MKKVRKLFWYGFIVVLLLLVSACKENGSEGEGQKSGEQIESGSTLVEQPNTPKEPTELVFLSVGNIVWIKEDVFMEHYGDPIRKKFPHIIPKTIAMDAFDTDTMNILLTNKEPIDVMLAANRSYFLYIKPYDLQTNIEPLIKQYNIDLTRFHPEFIEMSEKLGEGMVVGLPMSETAAQIIYNASIFDKFGVDHPPHDKWTWDEMYSLAKKITRVDGDVQYYGIGIDFSYLQRNPYSIDYVDTKTNKAIYNNDVAKKMINLFLRQFEGIEGAVNATNGANLFFNDRTLAMLMPGSALYPQPERYVGMEWDLAPIPNLPEMGDVSFQPYPNYLYVSKTSKQPDLAIQVIDFLTSESFQMEYSRQGLGVTPLKNPEIIKVFGQESEVFAGKNVSALLPTKYAPPAGVNLFSIDISLQFLNPGILKIISGEIDLNTALRDAEERSQKYIDERIAAGAEK